MLISWYQPIKDCVRRPVVLWATGNEAVLIAIVGTLIEISQFRHIKVGTKQAWGKF